MTEKSRVVGQSPVTRNIEDLVKYYIGDEVVLNYEDDITTVGTVIGQPNCDYYNIRWKQKLCCTHEHGFNLNLFRRAPHLKDNGAPKFQTGTRVYFIETAQKFPLGVVTYVNFVGVRNFDSTDHYVLNVLWDNGVTSCHEYTQIGRCDDAIHALSLPIP